MDMAWTEARGGSPPIIASATNDQAVRSLTGEVRMLWLG